MSLLAKVALVVVTATAVTGIAAAQPGAAQRTVRYADLDLSKRHDAAILYARLRIAANDVCDSYDGRAPYQFRMHEACYQQALSAAVASVNQATLTALHESQPRVRLAQRS